MARATLADIARRSGYSVATVSRALHNDASVVKSTREHVLRVCKELDYEPSVGGRLLSWGSKAVVGLSLGPGAHAAGRFVSHMYQALSQQLTRTGWSVELISHEQFNDDLDVGGLILLAEQSDDPRPSSAACRRIPTVAISHDMDCFCVAADDHRGGVLAAEHLLGLGRRNLAYLQGVQPGGGQALRVQAFAEAVRAAGVDPVRIEADVIAMPSLQGYRALAPRLAQGLRFDGIFCETDELAMGALMALEDAGISVPDGTAVVGFDDLPDLAGRLTTIRQDIPKLAEAAIKLLAEARRGAEPRNVLMPIELVQRETT